jgi:thiol reductant ABC exporter CydD subunit
MGATVGVAEQLMSRHVAGPLTVPRSDAAPPSTDPGAVFPGDGQPGTGPATSHHKARHPALPASITAAGERGSKRAPVDRRLLRLSPTTRRFLVRTALAGVAVALLVVAQAWLLADILDSAVSDGASAAALATQLALLLAVVATRAGLAYLQETAAERSAAQVKSQLRSAVLERAVLDRPPHATTSSRELATLVTRGVDALDGYFARFLPQLVLAVVVPFVVLVQIAVVDWVSGLLIAATLPLIPVFMVLVGQHTRRATDRQWHSLALLGGHFLDVVAGLATLKVFGRAKAQTATIREVGDRYRRATNRVLRVSFLSAFVLELAATLSVAVVAVGIGLRLLHGELGLHTSFLVLVLAPEAYLPIRNLGAAYHVSAEGLSVADRAFAVVDAPARVVGGRRDVADLAQQVVRVDHVRVRPPDAAADTLREVSFSVRPGETTVVTAPSGGGKSTLLAVLLGARRPDSGWVRVGSADLAEIDPAAWQDTVAWLPQRPLLFADTLAQNVRFGEPDATDEEVSHALRAARCDFVDALPGAAAATLGDAGAGLSAGQRQRVALARVLLRVARRDCRLVLLDEPTAHLDVATERQVVAAMGIALAGRTVVVATHRPAVTALGGRHVALREPSTTPVGGAA